MYLKGLVHELGMEVRSVATCSMIQCVRFGIFDLELALLKKHWNLACITSNMAQVRTLLRKNKFMTKPQDAVLTTYSDVKQIESKEVPQIEAQAE